MPWILISNLKNHQSYNEKKKPTKMTPLAVKIEFSKISKSLQILIIQDSLNRNITFLAEKL